MRHRGPQPRTLRDLSMYHVSELIKDICFWIHLHHEYSQAERLVAADRLQQHLVARIRPFLDEICTYTFSMNSNAEIELAEDIILATLMHTQMKKLIYASSIPSPFCMDQDLWVIYLSKVPNLVELNLSGIGYRIDNILKAIGSNFPKLEEICITGGKLSDEGFCHLAQAKSLRVIQNVDPNLLYITMSGNDHLCVSLLLQSLPRLEYVHCCCMGQVLCEWHDVTPLALTHCWEREPNKRRIKAITQHCPNLQHLRLGHQIKFNNSFDASPLANSSIQISSLELTSLSNITMLQDFFALKGMFITSVQFHKMEDITIDQIKSIGKHCKNIEVLKIELIHEFPQMVQYLGQPWVDDECIFENLLRFHFEVNGQWDLTAGLGCLLHSKKIQIIDFKTLSWSVSPHKSDLENILSTLIEANPMTELRALTLCGPFTLSCNLLDHFYNNLPKLEILKLQIDSVDIE